MGFLKENLGCLFTLAFLRSSQSFLSRINYSVVYVIRLRIPAFMLILFNLALFGQDLSQCRVSKTFSQNELARPPE